MEKKKTDEIPQTVPDSHNKTAEAHHEGSWCVIETNIMCCLRDEQINTLISTRLGYSEDDLKNVPEGADMGLGCGNPRAIASIQVGETIIDLGSGGGFDCFLAAQELNGTGCVIGIDMTPAMISKARTNAEKGGYSNVEFRLGEIEFLPVADNTVDVIISTCVINLSPNKPRGFSDAFRVLKPGGRLAISDVVASCELPEHIRTDLALYSGCMAGASLVEELEAFMSEAGVTDIRITPKDDSLEFIKDWAPGRGVEEYVISAHIEAIKPASVSCC